MRRQGHIAFVSVMALLAGCGGLKMSAAIGSLNSVGATGRQSPARPADERVAKLAERYLTDAYYKPADVAQWLANVGRHPEPMMTLVECIELARRQVRDATPCHVAFLAEDGAPAAWGLPTSAPTDLSPSDSAAQSELDAQRFLAGARSLGAALSQLAQSEGGALIDGPQGLVLGGKRVAAYLTKRSWRRGERPTTALVLGGGSANGAFSAGFVWRMLDVFEHCRNAGVEGCGDARVDLVAGTSTGTLIGALVDKYFTKGQEQEAMGLLLDNYTCSVEADLYCAPDEYVWKLVQDARGVVRFDGVASKIDRFVTKEVEDNALELVGVSVDLRYGEVLGFSDQDPQDATAKCGRRDQLLASIVLPVLAEPVAGIDLANGKKKLGPFVDGGVSSIVPMLEAVRRGAERMVVLSNYAIDLEPAASPRNAIDVLLRTLILALMGPGPSEMERAELFAMSRRVIEEGVCRERFASFARVGPSSAEIERFCKRDFGDAAAPKPWRGPLPIETTSDAMRSAWVFRTEGLQSAQGYAFDPVAMRGMFLSGVHTFQSRCHEMLDLLGIRGEAANKECAASDAEQRAAARFRDIGQCKTRPMKVCEQTASCNRD